MVPDEEPFKWAMSGCAKVPPVATDCGRFDRVSSGILGCQDRAWKFSVDVLREMLSRVLCKSHRIGWETIQLHNDSLRCMPWYLC